MLMYLDNLAFSESDTFAPIPHRYRDVALNLPADRP